MGKIYGISQILRLTYMNTKVTLIMDEFELKSGLKPYLFEKDNIVKCIINNRVYDVIFRGELRVAGIDRILSSKITTNSLIISDKIYGTAKQKLIEKNINFIEYEGDYFLEVDGNEYKLDRKNYYDQRPIKSRLEGDYGARICLALNTLPELLQWPLEELAKLLKMGNSTVYYYLAWFKKAKFIIQDEVTGLWRLQENRFKNENLISIILTRGCNKLVIRSKRQLWNFSSSYFFSQFADLSFYDELKYVENSTLELNKKLSAGSLVIEYPFDTDINAHLDELIRQEIRKWFESSKLVCQSQKYDTADHQRLNLS